MGCSESGAWANGAVKPAASDRCSVETQPSDGDEHEEEENDNNQQPTTGAGQIYTELFHPPRSGPSAQAGRHSSSPLHPARPLVTIVVAVDAVLVVS